jgi:outer membrane lipoprotein-sorting protein
VRRFLPLGALAGFALGQAAFGIASAAPTAPPPTVDQIISRYVAARGGLDKIRSVQTLRETGHATAGPNREAVVKRELKRPSRTRFEITSQGVTGVFVSNGEHGWKMSPFEGDADPMPVSDEVVKEAAEQADIEGPLVDWKAKGHKAELMGHETVGGKDAYKIKLTLKSGAVRYEYLDVKSLYRIRADSTRQIHGAPVRIETTFADYKKTDGVLFPRTIEVGAEGRPNKLHVVVDTIEVNPPLSDSLFEMPAQTQP